MRNRFIVFFLAALTLVAGCSSASTDRAGEPRDTLGASATSTTELAPESTVKTEVLRAIDTTQIWVDVSNGSDANSGHSPSSPFRTVRRAMSELDPGDSILLKNGTYPAIALENISGTSSQPLRIAAAPGQDNVVIADGGYTSRAAVGLKNAHHIIVEGLRLRTSLWAVDAHESSHLVFRDLTVTDIGQEAIHMRDGTHHVLIADNSITGTGQRPGYVLGGSGVYLGTARGDDQTHDIVIDNNDIFNTASEGIDVKAATYNVTIRNNRIHDIKTLQSGAVVLHLGERGPYFDPGLLVENNDIWNIESNTQWADGNAIVIDAAATVRGNRLWNTQHRGILVEGQFAQGNPTDILIENNIIWQSGRYDFEIKGSDADVVFRNNRSAEPRGTGFTSQGNSPATLADFENWSGTATTTTTVAINRPPTTLPPASTTTSTPVTPPPSTTTTTTTVATIPTSSTTTSTTTTAPTGSSAASTSTTPAKNDSTSTTAPDGTKPDADTTSTIPAGGKQPAGNVGTSTPLGNNDSSGNSARRPASAWFPDLTEEVASGRERISTTDSASTGAQAERIPTALGFTDENPAAESAGDFGAPPSPGVGRAVAAESTTKSVATTATTTSQIPFFVLIAAGLALVGVLVARFRQRA